MVALATEPAVKVRYRYTDTNGAHLHELDTGLGYAPLLGTSTVVDVIGKVLTWYASGMAVQTFGVPDYRWLTKYRSDRLSKRDTATLMDKVSEVLAKIKDMNVEEFVQILVKAYRAHHDYKEEAAVEGTNTHAVLERYVKDCIYDNAGQPCKLDKYASSEVEIFADWAVANVKEFLWSEGHCWSSTLWCGGISDCGVLMNDNLKAIIDFKRAKQAQFGHFVQCGGYAMQIQTNGIFNAIGDQITGPVEVNRLIVVQGDGTPVIREDVREFKFDFYCATNLYKHRQKFEPTRRFK